MWIVVWLAGMLNSAGGLPAGHSEMNDASQYTFETQARCEASREALTEAIIEDLSLRFGRENILVTSVCWAPSTRL